MQSATPFHTLHGIKETAESRKDVVIDGAQETSTPHFFGGRGRVLEEERRNMMKVPCQRTHCCLTGSLAAKAWV